MTDSRPAPFWRPALAGAAATCAGNGLARFAFVPLFPAMVAAGWVDGGGAGLLGAVNLAGYLAGALGGQALAARLGTARTLDLGMALVALSMAACAVAGGLYWFLPWRGLAGLAGGVLMALAGPATQAQVLPSRRGSAGGVVIGGVAGGVSLAAVAVPAFLAEGLAAAWLGLAGIVLLLWAFAHPRWPRAAIVNPRALPGGTRPRAPLLLLAYGLSGAGLVAPMVYLADLAARGRGLGVAMGSAIWFLFGIGGMLGAMLLGRLADRIGGMRAVQLALAAQVLALGFALPPWAPLLVPASLLSGFAGVGVTAALLATARERAGAVAGWLFARATAAFGIAQASTAFALAALFAASGENHAAVFGCGLVLSVAALLVALWPRRGGRITG